jgi:hypothetical protein
MPDLCCLVSRLSQESLLVAIIVILVSIVDWAQEMAEGPTGPGGAPVFGARPQSGMPSQMRAFTTASDLLREAPFW